jgi:hypothetical protein
MQENQFHKFWLKAGLSDSLYRELAFRFSNLTHIPKPPGPLEFYARRFLAKGATFFHKSNINGEAVRTSTGRIRTYPAASNKNSRKINELVMRNARIPENSSLSVTVGPHKDRKMFLVLPYGPFRVLRHREKMSIEDIHDRGDPELAADMAMKFEIVRNPYQLKNGEPVILIGLQSVLLLRSDL